MATLFDAITNATRGRYIVRPNGLEVLRVETHPNNYFFIGIRILEGKKDRIHLEATKNYRLASTDELLRLRQQLSAILSQPYVEEREARRIQREYNKLEKCLAMNSPEN